MKAFFLILVSLAPIFSLATPAPVPTLLLSVARHLQALADDTVNEGAQNAQVVFEGAVPAVSCKVSDVKNQPGVKWAFCKVQFEVSFEDSEETVQRECNVLFSFNPARVNQFGPVLERNEDHIADCLETLSEGP